MSNEFWKSVAILSGCVVGAGVLGLPYVVAKAGFLTGLLTISVLGVIVVFLCLYFGEVVLRTKGNHQMTGYAGIYLGKFGKYLMSLLFWFGITGALTAYMLGVGDSAFAILKIGSPILYSIIFFIIGTVILFFGLRVVAGAELLLFFAIMLIVVIITLFSLPHLNSANIDLTLKPAKLLLPYGVSLFAFLGLQAVPEMKRELNKNKRKLKKAILIGMTIPFLLYLIFPAIVVSVSGLETTELATTGLGKFIGPLGYILGNIFAMLTMSTSFFILGLALKDSLMFDYRMNRHLAWFLTCTIPFGLAVSKVASFIEIIGLVGVVMGGIEGILVTLMIIQAKKHGNRKPEYSIPINWIALALLFLLFIGGTASYFIYLI